MHLIIAKHICFWLDHFVGSHEFKIVTSIRMAPNGRTTTCFSTTTKTIYMIIPKPKLRSVPPFAKECIYITPPMVLAKTPNQPKRGHGLGYTK